MIAEGFRAVLMVTLVCCCGLPLRMEYTGAADNLAPPARMTSVGSSITNVVGDAAAATAAAATRTVLYMRYGCRQKVKDVERRRLIYIFLMLS